MLRYAEGLLEIHVAGLKRFIFEGRALPTFLLCGRHWLLSLLNGFKPLRGL